MHLNLKAKSPHNNICFFLRSLSEHLERKLEHILHQERRLLRIIVIIVGAYVMCWAPFWTVYLITPLCSSGHQWCRWLAREADDFHFVIQWLGYANSMVNPIIYTVFNAEIRKALLVWKEESKKFLCMVLDIK